MISKIIGVYILTNFWNKVLYVGSTNNIERRLKEHKRLTRGFTLRYKVTKLVYFENCLTLDIARKREKQIKNLLRSKKVKLITQTNPQWLDIYYLVKT